MCNKSLSKDASSHETYTIEIHGIPFAGNNGAYDIPCNGVTFRISYVDFRGTDLCFHRTCDENCVIIVQVVVSSTVNVTDGPASCPRNKISTFAAFVFVVLVCSGCFYKWYITPGTPASVEVPPSPNNKQFNTVYATPMQSDSRSKHWMPGTDESGINPQVTEKFRVFDFQMEAAIEDMRSF